MSKLKITGKFIYENGKRVSSDKRKQPVLVKKQVYEVLRVVNGKPLFWEEHYNRFLHSIYFIEWEGELSKSYFKEQLIGLIAANSITEGNIWIDFILSEPESLLRFAFIPHSYPSEDDYKNGISVGLFTAERDNPHAKVVQAALREKANELISQRNIYEVLLVDSDGFVEEGSRSNIFFVKGDVLFTPLASKVLLGITRMKVLECIKEAGLKCIEADIHVDSLTEYDAVFLTGTSPKVLPVAKIEETGFDVHNQLLRKVLATYDRYIDDYLRAF